MRKIISRLWVAAVVLIFALPSSVFATGNNERKKFFFR